MNLYIASIKLWFNGFRENPQRTITYSFKSDKINVITGDSSTGKSSILGIIDYLLLSDDPIIVENIINENIEFYGMNIYLDGISYILIRKAPLLGKGTQDVYWEEQIEYPIPYTPTHTVGEMRILLTKMFEVPESHKNVLLRGAFEVQEKNFYYAQEMRYPQQGGYKSFLNTMATNTSIKTQKEVALIDPIHKKITFTDGSETNYEKLISSLPLPEIGKIIKDAPKKVVEAGEKLLATSGQLVSIGFNRPDIPKHLWFYIYDEDILPARAYSPSLKSPYNVPKGKSSLQFETYFSKKKPKQLSGDSMVNHIIEKGIQMKLWELNDIAITDYQEENYANVVFDFNRKSNVALIQDYLRTVGIISIGRFGEWDYFWSDQSLLSGFKGANIIGNR